GRARPPRRRARGAPPIGASGGVTPARLLGNPPLADRLDAQAFVVSPSAIVDSEFNAAHAGRAQRVGHGGADEMFAAVRDILRAATARRYVYAYSSGSDSPPHPHGSPAAPGRTG